MEVQDLWGGKNQGVENLTICCSTRIGFHMSATATTDSAQLALRELFWCSDFVRHVAVLENSDRRCNRT
eukprot:3516890-Amphidinium_carterae.1